MGDVFQVLIILGIVGFAIIRQALKTNTQKPQSKLPPTPEFEEFDYIETGVNIPLPPPETLTVQQFKAQYKKPAQTKPGEVLKSPLQETEKIVQEFDIHSTEEVKKGILWSEILNKKY